MIRVGLTGGIGSGKTTVARFFVELGVPVYNSDIAAKKLMTTSSKVKEAIIELLGKEAYEGKKLNKNYIADRIFTDAALLQKMNGIVHPAVAQDFLTWESQQEYPYVIQETALIFENSKQDFYDFIILVTAPKSQRLQRVMQRDDASEKEVLDRFENQLEDGEKIPFSDYVLENILLDETRNEVRAIHNALLANSE